MEVKIKEYSESFFWQSPSSFHTNKNNNLKLFISKEVNICFLYLHMKGKG